MLLTAGEQPRGTKMLARGREVWNLRRLHPEDLARVYQAAYVGVVLSVSEESLPLAALEMMTSGLPVVASRVGGIPEVVDHGVTGVLADIPTLSRRGLTRSLLSSPTVAPAVMGNAARKAALERFVPESGLEIWMRLITQLGSPEWDA